MIDLGGTLREITPAQTLAKLKPLLLKTFGITRVADVTGLDNIGLPVCVAIRPNSKTLSNSQGKGISQELAMISAIMESIETWHAENTPIKPLIASYNELIKTEKTFPIEKLFCGYFSYEDVFNQKIAWCKTRDLISKENLYLPFSMISLDSTQSCLGKELFTSTSNGLAAGNTFDEALCHALYEAVERDAVSKAGALNTLEREQKQIRLSTINSAHNNALIEKIRACNYELYVWDVTSEYGIPAYMAELDDKNHIRGLGLFTGYGAHLSKEVALSRAITEAVQSRLTYISGARDDINPVLYERERFHADYPSEGKQDYQKKPQAPLPNTFKACADLVIEKLQQKGIRHISLVDHTRTDIGIPVAHVTIPDLKFNWRDHRMVM